MLLGVMRFTYGIIMDTIVSLLDLVTQFRLEGCKICTLAVSQDYKLSFDGQISSVCMT